MTGRDPATLDLGRPTALHIIGIGGTGMSAIATVLVGMGHRVSGSDQAESAFVDRLRGEGVDVAVGHAAGNLPDGEVLVARSTAVGDDNPEVVAARSRGLSVLSRAEVLAAIAGVRPAIAVAGTHGKTTTCSMLAVLLNECGRHPSFVIGGLVNQLGTNARWADEDGWFVVEADESDRTFLALPRRAAVVTSVEPDHLESYGGRVEGLEAAFAAFLAETDGPVVVSADEPTAARLGRQVGATTFGTAGDADYRMVDVRLGAGSVSFDVERDGGLLARVEVPVPGIHNARNACGALVAAIQIGLAPPEAATALGHFGGVARRMEPRGTAAGVTFVDDYAHLPSEVADALATARDGQRDGAWSRIVCVFQPHRYSRTQALWADFADAFGDADVLAITDIYAAGETRRPGVTGKLVVDAVLDAHPRRRLAWLPRRSDVISWLVSELRPGDLCLTLGAGDLTSVPGEVIGRLG